MNVFLDDSALFNWVILPLLIYLARLADVSLGTMSIITLSRGLRRIAPVLGFFEVLIWLVTLRQIFNDLGNPLCSLAYAGGFASGVYSGMWIEHRLAMGLRVIRIITRYDARELIQNLRERGFVVTAINAEGSNGPAKMIFTVVKRRDVAVVKQMTWKCNPKAFLSVESVDESPPALFPGAGRSPLPVWLPLFSGLSPVSSLLQRNEAVAHEAERLTNGESASPLSGRA